MGGIRGNYCSACGRHLMYCQCGESCSASERQGEAAAPVAEDVALPPLPEPDDLRDAARYRWLRQFGYQALEIVFHDDGILKWTDDLDLSIDAVMSISGGNHV